MRAGKMVVTVGLILYAALCAGDTITLGGATYENVYVCETPSRYLICFPETGQMVAAPKSDVAPENLTIVQDREIRKGLYDKWLSKRNEAAGYPSSSTGDDADNAGASSASAAEPADDAATAKKAPMIVGSPSSYSTPEEAAQQARDEELRGQRQTAIAQKRRQREAMKYRALTNRRVYTSQDARGSSVQWNNSAQWNNSGQFGNSGRFGY